MNKLLAGAAALATVMIAAPVAPAHAQGKQITLCWAAWDPANATSQRELKSKSKLCDLLIGDSQ